jgi:hypothetical protein
MPIAMTDQIEMHMLDELGTRCPYEEGPVVLIIILCPSHKPMLVAYQHHETLNTILSDPRSTLNFLFHPSLRVCYWVSRLQLRSQLEVWFCGSLRPTHGTVRFEVIRGVVVRVELGQFDVGARDLDVFDAGRG